MLVLKVKKTHPSAKLPAYAKHGDVACDLFSVEKVEINPMARCQVHTGIAVEFPEGYFGAIWDKSGLSHKHGLKTMGGIIDAGYRGEIMVGVINLSDKPYHLGAGDKIAQMVIQKIENVDVKEVAELSVTERGADGFGSTGK